MSLHSPNRGSNIVGRWTAGDTVGSLCAHFLEARCAISDIEVVQQLLSGHSPLTSGVAGARFARRKKLIGCSKVKNVGSQCVVGCAILDISSGY